MSELRRMMGCSVDDRVSTAFGSMSLFLLKLAKYKYT